MVKILLNKYTWIALLLISLSAYSAYQEIRYKDTLLTVQEKDKIISDTTLRLSQSLEDNNQLLLQVEASEAVILRYQSAVNRLKDERDSLNNSIEIVYEDDKDVKEILDTKLPNSILDLLR